MCTHTHTHTHKDRAAQDPPSPHDTCNLTDNPSAEKGEPQLEGLPNREVTQVRFPSSRNGMLPVCYTLMHSSLNHQKQAHPTAGRQGTMRGPGTAGPAQGATLPSCKPALSATVQGAHPYLTVQRPCHNVLHTLMTKAGPSWGMPCGI